MYVADHKNHRAQKFTPDGEFVASFGREGSGQGELNRPTDVAVDPEGDVYVCDWANNRVIFAPDFRREVDEMYQESIEDRTQWLAQLASDESQKT